MAIESFIFPASFAQQRLWFLDQLHPNQSVYNMAYSVRFEAPIKFAELERTLNEIVRRHESLRTTFASIDGQPKQVVQTHRDFTLPVVELSHLPPDERDVQSRRWIEQEAGRPFDLAKGPLLRTTLVHLGEQENVLFIVMHHIISDGWSMGVLLRELAILYEAFSEKKQSPLCELPVQYADYAAWQREWLQSNALEEQVSYWREHLRDAPATLELASDRPRPPIQTFKGARLFTEFPARFVDGLRALSRREGVTLFMTLLAAFDVLLGRYSGQSDFIVGTPVAARNRSELEGLVGFFANTLPLRANLSDNPTFRELLIRVREVALEAYAHQDLPLDRLIEKLRPERRLSHTPLFQTIFALENTPQSLHFSGLNMKWLEVDYGTSRCDLSVFANDKGAELSCWWEYNTDLFDGETVGQMMSGYRTLLESILDHPDRKISHLEIWTEGARRRLLQQSGPERTSAVSEMCMHHLFEAQAERTPDSIAVLSGAQSLTYRELNARANQLAHHLQKLGVGPETPVGVCLERSAELIVALLGVLKAGGAYVPVDPDYPAERLAFMLKNSSVPVLLTQKHLLETLPSLSIQIVSVDDQAQLEEEHAGALTRNPSSTVTPENLAYVIYTSGSTGRPKGIQVRHESVIHLFAATRNQLGFRASDIWTVVHSSAFDFSVWEIWGSLLQGGTLVVVPLEVVQSPADFYDLLCAERVTILNQTPSALRELLRARAQARTADRDWSVRVIVCGGDALDQELAAQLSELCIPVWNFYGPTEGTVWTTCDLIAQTDASATLNSIGHPIADLQVYLLNQQLELVPNGVAAELFIGGAGLARGYFNRPELTAEKFIPNPFSDQPGARLYRTGDLVRRRRDGKLEFAGRIDTQVKLRGFRVELGEIETALSQHSYIAQAVVIVRADRPGDKTLVAYLVAKDGKTFAAGELRKYLQVSLPDYMVPAAFVMLEAMPLTPNKKVDRRLLPSPDYSTVEQSSGFVAARTPIEEIVADIWARVLGLEEVGVNDNFFALGGHSLLATQVMSRLHDAFQVDLQLRALFEAPSVAGLAEKIEGAQLKGEGLRAPPLLAVERTGNLPLSFAQQRLWFLDQLEPGSPFYNISRALRLGGLLNVSALSRAIDEIIQRHESLRTSFGAENGTPFQRITHFESRPLPLMDLTKVPETERRAQARQVAAEEIKQPFDLTHGPLLRALLLRQSDDEHVLILTMHHIAADGWSIGVLFRELIALYESFVGAKPSTLPTLSIQYADYAVWQRQWLRGEVLEKLLSYWRKQLAGAPPVLELPADNPRPQVQSFRGAYETLALPEQLASDLKRLSQNQGVTLFMTCLAAFQLLLSRFSGQQDLIVGTDVANRNRVETESLIGCFTNLLPLRAKLSGDLKFSELLRQVRETTLEGYAHQDLPFEKLVEELAPERALGRNPLVQVLLVMQNQPTLLMELPELTVSPFDLPLESSRFDLALFLWEPENGLAGFWLFNPDIFEPQTVCRLSFEYEKLLANIAADPAARLDAYEVFGEEVRRKKIQKDRQQQSQLNRLRDKRRKGIDLTRVSGVTTRSLLPDQPLPLVIEPENAALDLGLWAAANQNFINEKLLKHGAILFHGFDVNSVDEFEQFASAICPELFAEYGDLPREELGGKIYGSTPYPADETILFHNESSHMHRWPMLIWFYCVKAAAAGGESPIIDCRRIYRLMDTAVRERFEQRGLMYVRNFANGLDVSWQDFFHTRDKSEVENYCRRAGIDFEWRGSNGLRTRQFCPAVVRHPQTSELVFFNQLQLHHISCLAPAVRESLLSMMKEEDLPRNVYYGDGSVIEDWVLEHLGELYRKTCVGFPWRERDVLMLNNMLVAHSRNPFVGERKIVVALGNPVGSECVGARPIGPVGQYAERYT
jgi:amino acid adenylation domain-containing protein